MISSRKNIHFCIIDIKGVAKMSCAILAHVEKRRARKSRSVFCLEKNMNFLWKNNVFWSMQKATRLFAFFLGFSFFLTVCIDCEKPLLSQGRCSIFTISIINIQKATRFCAFYAKSHSAFCIKARFIQKAVWFFAYFHWKNRWFWKVF